MGTYFWERVGPVLAEPLSCCLGSHAHFREATRFATRPMLVAGRRSRDDRKPALHLTFLGPQAGGAGRDRHGWTTRREFISDARILEGFM